MCQQCYTKTLAFKYIHVLYLYVFIYVDCVGNNWNQASEDQRAVKAERRVLDYASLLDQKGIGDLMTKYMQINDPTAGERCFMVILTFPFILITHQTKPQPALSNF